MNLDKVHDVVTRHVPILIAELEPLITALEVEAGWSEEDGSSDV